MLEFTQRYWYRQVKLFFCFVVSIAMSAFCAVDKDAPTRINFIGWLGLLFFGGGGLFVCFKKIMYSRQGRKCVMITEQGLVIANDVIPWSSITGFKRWNGPGGVILVMTNDCEEQIAKAGWLKRKNMEMSYNMSGAVYSFSDSELVGSLEDFVEQCRPYISETGKAPV